MSLSKCFQNLWGSYLARMTVALILTMVLLVLFFVLYMMGTQRKDFEDETVREGLAIADMLAQTVRFAVFAENVDGFTLPVAAVLNHEYMVNVSVFNTSGKLIFKKTRAGEELPREIDTPGHLDQVIKGLVDKSAMHWQAENSFSFIAPVYLANESVTEEALYFKAMGAPLQPELIGYVSLCMTKKGYEQRLKKVLAKGIVAALSFLVLGLVFIFFIVRNLSRPLSDLLSKVKAQINVQNSDYGDLNLLSSTFGAMIRDLEAAFVEIKELNEGLEKTVTDRTRQLAGTNEELSAGKEQLEKTLLELRSTQSQLLQQEKMAAIGRLLAGIAHEMNNSANYISGAVPPLKRCLVELHSLGEEQGDGKAEELKENIDHLANNIELGARRLAGILHDLRIFSHKSQDDMPVEVDILSVLDSSLPLANGGDFGRVEVIKQYGELDKVSCLPGRMSQVFVNILTNAIQAMAGGGTLTVRAWQDEEMTHISFKDTGCGMDTDILSRIFEPFYTTKKIGKGTGLGLGISYSIVRQNGGNIKVESKKGIGTVFDVSLPRHGKERVLKERL